MLSAITNNGGLSFMVCQGRFKTPVFVAFRQRLLKQVAGHIYLIVDGQPVHRSGAAKRVVDQYKQRQRLIRMPGYCPERNPDELSNQAVETNELGKS